jgi:hypothetical protein
LTVKPILFLIVAKHSGGVANRERGFWERLKSPPVLIYFRSGGGLSGLQKCPDEFAFAADRQAGKFFEPFAFRHFRFCVQPLGQQAELVGGNVPGFDSVKEVRKQRPRKMAALNAGHG